MEPEFLLAEQELKQCGYKAIELAKTDSKKEGKSIVAKRRKGGIYIVEYLRKVPLLDCFSPVFLYIYQPIRRYHDSHSEIREGQFDNLSNLIESQGGLTKAIANLRTYLHVYGNKAKQLSDEEMYYGSTVLGLCLDAKFATTRKSLCAYHSPLPYCALCWRRIEDSKYYCQLHHPHHSRKNYYSARTALIHAVKISAPQFREELTKKVDGSSNAPWALLMYKWTGSFSPPVAEIKAQFPTIDKPENSWRDIASMIIAYSKVSLPHTYEKLRNVTPSDFASWRDFCLAVIAALDSTESAFWAAQENDEDYESAEHKDWIHFSQPISAWIVLLSMLGRHEAYEIVCSVPNHRGPKKGEVPVNETLRGGIREEVERIHSEGGKVVQAQIARKFGVSRNIVNRHMKTLGLQ